MFYLKNNTEIMVQKGESLMKNYIRFKIFDIMYDTDGEIVELPASLIFYLREDKKDYILDQWLIDDEISDYTGWLISGYQIEEIGQRVSVNSEKLILNQREVDSLKT